MKACSTVRTDHLIASLWCIVCYTSWEPIRTHFTPGLNPRTYFNKFSSASDNTYGRVISLFTYKTRYSLTVELVTGLGFCTPVAPINNSADLTKTRASVTKVRKGSGNTTHWSFQCLSASESITACQMITISCYCTSHSCTPLPLSTVHTWSTRDLTAVSWFRGKNTPSPDVLSTLCIISRA